MLHHLCILWCLSQGWKAHYTLILRQALLLVHPCCSVGIHRVSCIIVHSVGGRSYLLLSQLSIGCSCISGVQYVVDLHSCAATLSFDSSRHRFCQIHVSQYVLDPLGLDNGVCGTH